MEPNQISTPNLESSPAFPQTDDLLSVLPAKFINIPYNLDAQTKRKTLQDSIEALNAISPSTIDFSHEYTAIFNVLTHVLDDPSITFFTEGLRLFQSLLKLFANKTGSFPVIRLKNCFRLLLEKNKGNSHKISMIFDQALKTKAISLEQLTDFMASSIESTNKISVKTVCLEYLEHLYEQKLEKRHLWETLAKRLEVLMERKENTAKTKAKIKQIVAKFKENPANKENCGPKNCENSAFLEEFREKIQGSVTSAPLFRQVLENYEAQGLIEQHFHAFIAILLGIQRNLAIIEPTIYLQLKSLIVNCPKNLNNIEDFQNLLEVWTKNKRNFPIFLENTVKLLEKLTNDLQYLYSVEKAQLLLRILLFSLEKAVKTLENGEVTPGEMRKIAKKLQEVKVPGLTNLHKPLLQALIERFPCTKDTKDEKIEKIADFEQKPDDFHETPANFQEKADKSEEISHKSQEISANPLFSPKKLKESCQNPKELAKSSCFSHEKLHKSPQKPGFQAFFEAISQHLHANPSNKHWKRGIGRPIASNLSESEALELIKSTFEAFSLENKDKMFPLVLELRDFFPQFSQEIAGFVFEFLVIADNYNESKEIREHFEGFLSMFFKAFEKSTVLRCFSQNFAGFRDNCAETREKLRKLVKNALFPLIYRLLNDEIQIKDLEFLAESLIFCLMDESLRQVGKEIMYKLANLHSAKALRASFERFLLKNEKFYVFCKDWMEKDELFNKKPSSYELFEEEISRYEEKIARNEENVEKFTENAEKPIENVEKITENTEKPIENTEKTMENTEKFIENRMTVLNNSDLLGICELFPENSLTNPSKDYRSLYESLENKHKDLETRFIALNTEYLNAIQQLSCKTPQSFMENPLETGENSMFFAKNLNKNTSFSTDFHDFESLQEFFLDPEPSESSVFASLLAIYKHFSGDIEKKLAFLSDLKQNIVSARVLSHLSSFSQRKLLEFLINLCCCDETQKFLGKGLEKELQIMLDAVMKAKKPQITVFSLVSALNGLLPADFSKEIGAEMRLSLRLAVKCIEKTVESQTSAGKNASFKALLAIYRLMKRYPAENLHEDLPSVRELENVYRGIKKTTDFLVRNDKESARDLLEIVGKHEKSGVFLEYVRSLAQK